MPTNRDVAINERNLVVSEISKSIESIERPAMRIRKTFSPSDLQSGEIIFMWDLRRKVILLGIFPFFLFSYCVVSQKGPKKVPC